MKFRSWISAVVTVASTVVVTLQGAPSTPSTSGLIGWWTLNETSGTVAHDASGNGNDGVVGAGVTLGIPGARATGFAFGPSGTAVHVPYGNGSLAPPTTNITLSAWILPTGGCGVTEPCGIVSNECAFGDDWYLGCEGYGLRLLPGPTLQFCWGADQASSCTYAPFTAPLGAWANVAASYDGVNSRLYVDGTLLGVGAPGGFAGPLNTMQGVVIGNIPQGNLPFTGGIDDVRIFNRTLSDSEIAAAAQALPGSKDQCKQDLFAAWGAFKNQGDCVSFVASGGRNRPDGQ